MNTAEDVQHGMTPADFAARADEQAARQAGRKRRVHIPGRNRRKGNHPSDMTVPVQPKEHAVQQQSVTDVPASPRRTTTIAKRTYSFFGEVLHVLRPINGVLVGVIMIVQIYWNQTGNPSYGVVGFLRGLAMTAIILIMSYAVIKIFQRATNTSWKHLYGMAALFLVTGVVVWYFFDRWPGEVPSMLVALAVVLAFSDVVDTIESQDQSRTLEQLTTQARLVAQAELATLIQDANRRDELSHVRQLRTEALLSKAMVADSQSRAILAALPNQVIEAARPLVEAATKVNKQQYEAATAKAQLAESETEATRIHVREEVQQEFQQRFADQEEVIRNLRQQLVSSPSISVPAQVYNPAEAVVTQDGYPTTRYRGGEDD